ncbi:MAG: phosphatidylinositol-3-phosphatase [Gaiellales bacterium]|nr:phosphatidylinositol-3-phosphatase [Gaiellales bacterium]
MRRLFLIVMLSALVVMAGSAGTSSASGTTPTLASSHVYLIIGENTEITQVNKTNAPYIMGALKPQSAWLTDYFALTHFSESNYVGMMSGQFTHCQQFDYSAAKCHQDVPNLFSQLDDLGVSWQSWMESMPTPCALASSGAPKTLNHYGAKHNPAIFFDNIEGTGGVWSTTPGAECTTNDIPTGGTGPNDMSVFNAAVQSGDTAQFNLVVPNECEDGHDNCQPAKNKVRQFDTFLSREVPIIQNADPNALIIITYDEGTSNKGPAYSKQFSGGGNVVFLALGPLVQPGIYGSASNHYGLLATLEDGYGASRLAGAATASPIVQIWK